MAVVIVVYAYWHDYPSRFAYRDLRASIAKPSSLVEAGRSV
jgi:hypothetical protein